MKQALGLIEISGLSTAVVAADTMAKAANIRILEIENTKGLGYMTIRLPGTWELLTLPSMRESRLERQTINWSHGRSFQDRPIMWNRHSVVPNRQYRPPLR